MNAPRTLADLLQLFAGCEQRGLDLYRHFAQAFAAEPLLGSIWRAMSDAEAGHYAILRLAEDRLPRGDTKGVARLSFDEARLAEWRATLEALDAKGRRPGLAPAEAVQITVAWEREELPLLLSLLSALPEPARRMTAAGFVEGADEHLRSLRELLKAVGSDTCESEVTQLEESVTRLRRLAQAPASGQP